MALQPLIKKLVPQRLIGLWRYYQTYNVPKQKRLSRKIIEQVSKNNHVNVLFIVSSISMWRYEGVLKYLLSDRRFSVKVIAYPFNSYNSISRENEYHKISNHFSQYRIDFSQIKNSEQFLEIKRDFKPNIIFYPQPYEGLYGNALEWSNNLDCLIAYVPYFLSLAIDWWGYNLGFHLLAWKHYQPSAAHVKQAKKIAYNRGENLVVVGEPRADEFKMPIVTDPWKKINDGKKRRRIIWAPHFQITGNGFLVRRDFLWAGETMLLIAQKYTDTIQIAFKPHPKLKTALYTHPDWGKEKTDRYYEQWEIMTNTQLIEGEYTDLFKCSDAMIHNCSSFSGEYLYVRKPVAYLSVDEKSIRKNLNDFGNRCIDCHYILNSLQSIENFIKDVVIAGNDSLKYERELIYFEQMAPPENSSVAENIYNDLVNSLHLK